MTKTKTRRGRILRTLTVLRTRLGLSQEGLARSVQVSQPEISFYETGALPIPDARAEMLLAALSQHEKSTDLPDGIRASDLAKAWDEVLLRLSNGD